MGEQIDLRAFLICFQRIVDDWLDRGGGEVGVRHGIGGTVVRDEKMIVEMIPEPCLMSIACYFPRVVRPGRDGDDRRATTWNRPRRAGSTPFSTL